MAVLPASLWRGDFPPWCSPWSSAGMRQHVVMGSRGDTRNDGDKARSCQACIWGHWGRVWVWVWVSSVGHVLEDTGRLGSATGVCAWSQEWDFVIPMGSSNLGYSMSP